MKSRGKIAMAILLMALGGWFLAIEFVPQVEHFAYGATTWPLPIVGTGVLLALLALFTWTPGMMVPAAIVGGVGSLLYWQNLTGNWASWAYAWALIVVFVGVGIGLAALMQRSRSGLAGAGWTIFIGLLQFVIFGAFLGGDTIIRRYWPVTLIVLGLLLLLQGFFRRSRPLT